MEEDANIGRVCVRYRPTYNPNTDNRHLLTDLFSEIWKYELYMLTGNAMIKGLENTRLDLPFWCYQSQDSIRSTIVYWWSLLQCFKETQVKASKTWHWCLFIAVLHLDLPRTKIQVSLQTRGLTSSSNLKKNLCWSFGETCQHQAFPCLPLRLDAVFRSHAWTTAAILLRQLGHGVLLGSRKYFLVYSPTFSCFSGWSLSSKQPIYGQTRTFVVGSEVKRLGKLPTLPRAWDCAKFQKGAPAFQGNHQAHQGFY